MTKKQHKQTKHEKESEDSLLPQPVKVNSLLIGNLQLHSPYEPMSRLITYAKKILDDKTFNNYLMLVQKNKLISSGAYS